MKVLVVDDDPVLARAIRRLFPGHEVVIEHGADEALERLRGGEWFDLILCDERLPGIKGSEILREVRLLHGVDSPMLVSMSGGDEVAVPTADVRLAKPFKHAEVADLIETWREMKKQRSSAATRRIPKL